MTTPSNDISNNVYSKKTEHAGNGLFTSEDIAAGELILEIDRPFLAVLDTPRLNDACSNCFVWVPAGGTAVDGDDRENVTLRACTGCKVVKYCGKTCQSTAWTHHHKHECKIFSHLYPKILPHTARMLLLLLLLLKAHALPPADWHAFLALESHLSLIRATRPSTWETLTLISRAAQSYSRSPEPLSLIHTLMARLLINTHTLTSPTLTPLGLYLSAPASLLNHSCAPNTTLIFHHRALSLRALHPPPRHRTHNRVR
ncbi:MAG: hypothetical protein FRX48_06312 [Lasallia pustulata]|uniref:Uncharacterized protein n=1 Tax=Lasallia pustulata TaxID=136370 RepID=A0A5M8PKW5_9LECA|nr:MAG: hypothetical protein FRX48_06312 [Lasallia pustulata]